MFDFLFQWSDTVGLTLIQIALGILVLVLLSVGRERESCLLASMLRTHDVSNCYSLLVIIGFTAAFIVMLFPNPVSSRVLVRKTLSAIINEVGNIFVTEVENFLLEEVVTRHNKISASHTTLRMEDEFGGAASKDERIKMTSERVMAVAVSFRGRSFGFTFHAADV